MSQRVDKDSLPLDKPRRTPNHPTKSHIVKTKVDGKEKIIRFGEQGASTAGKPKSGESERMKAKRASFKARHAKNIAKGKSSAAYWADRVKWAEGGAVNNRRTRGTPALDLIEQMRRSGQRNEPEFNLASLPRAQRRERLPTPPLQPAPPAAAGVLESAPTRVQTPQNFPGETANDATPTRNVTYDGNNPLVRAAAEAAQRYNIPVPLFLAQIQQESRFNPSARSPVGALGLGQLMPATARELNVDPNDPLQNLDGSARYMRQMLDRFGEVPLALAAYNAGPGRVREAGNAVPDIRETRNYVSTIMRNAGIPGYAEGGLAELDRRYAEGGAVTSGPMAYNPDQIEALAREVEGGQGYAEGGEVSSEEDKEYDRRLMERWSRDQGFRVDNPTRSEQRAALASAGREAADTAAELLLPQSPLDFALMAALGPGGRAVRIPAAAALAAMEPSEAEAGRVRRGLQAAGRAIRGAPETPSGIITYHGTPHTFPAERLIRRPDGSLEYITGGRDRLPEIPAGAELVQDFPLGRFRSDKIGTGEGAQVYSHGHYTAEAEPVARSYRDTLSPGSVLQIDGTPVNSSEWTTATDLLRAGGDVDSYINMLRERVLKYRNEMKNNPNLEQIALREINNIEQQIRDAENLRGRTISEVPRGSMYEVRLNVDPNRLLDWDAPLSAQSPELQENVLRAWREGDFARRTGNPEIPREAFMQTEGGGIARMMSEASPVEAAQSLREAGIPGLRYLDQGSRGVGQGTRNYVMYDEGLMEILRRYGLLPGAFGAGAAAATSTEGEAREYAHGGKVDAGLEGMYRRYYEGGGVDGGSPSDDAGSASTAEGQSAAGGVSGEGAGPTGAGAGSPADSGPDGGSGPSGVGGGSMSDPEGTAAAANMNTAAQAAAMGYGYNPATGFAGTGVGPTGFHADPGALGAISGMLSGSISPTQALGYAMQSAIPGATIGTQIDEFGAARPAANVDFGSMIGNIAGTMAGLATGYGFGAGRVGGMVGSALGQALGYEPGVVSYSPGVYGGPETPDISGTDYLNYGRTYGSTAPQAPQPLQYNYGYGPSWSPYYQGMDFR